MDVPKPMTSYGLGISMAPSPINPYVYGDDYFANTGIPIQIINLEDINLEDVVQQRDALNGPLQPM